MKLHSDKKKARENLSEIRKTTITLLRVLKYRDKNMKMNRIECNSDVKKRNSA